MAKARWQYQNKGAGITAVKAMANEEVWDPLRKKMVALTAEERVRQWFIGFLRDSLHVPVYMMMSEVGMKFGDGPRKKTFRADILVYDRAQNPLMIVECKRPDVPLDKTTIEQALRYDLVLGVRYIVITNGKNSYICRRNGTEVEFLDKAPSWQEMVSVGPEPGREQGTETDEKDE